MESLLCGELAAVAGDNLVAVTIWNHLLHGLPQL